MSSAATAAKADTDADVAIDHTAPRATIGNNICSLSHLKNVESHVMAAPEPYTKRR